MSERNREILKPIPRTIESCQSNSGLCLRWDFQWEMTCFHYDSHTAALSLNLCRLLHAHLMCNSMNTIMPVITDLIRYCSGAHIIYILCNVFPVTMHMWACVCHEEDLHIQTYTTVTCWPAPVRIFTRSNQHNMFYSCQHVCPSMHCNISLRMKRFVNGKGYNVHTWNGMWCCVLKKYSGLNTRYAQLL